MDLHKKFLTTPTTLYGGLTGPIEWLTSRSTPLSAKLMFDVNKLNRRALEYYPALKKLDHYVRTNYHDRITLGTAANLVGKERKYFCTYFRQKVGVSFGQWLRWVRIEQAIRLLETEDRNVTEVAFACGFQDVRTFERAFKVCTQCTAKDFRQRVRNAAISQAL